MCSGNPRAYRIVAENSKLKQSTFNPELILLKPSRNAYPLPYSHWGGTDREELKTRARDGVRALQFFDRFIPKASHFQTCFPRNCPFKFLPRFLR